MKCPHCQVEFRENPTSRSLTEQQGTAQQWGVIYQHCPTCDGFILELLIGEAIYDNKGRAYKNLLREFLVYPRVAARLKAPPEVPSQFADDYNEAALILADSPKASAALSRGCLQHVLRENANVKHSKLYDEIQEVVASNSLPPYLATDLDAVRNIGNFAAHPIKSTSSGQVVPVEPGEAEWNLDVLEGLFDFYFVQPERAKTRKDALNVKLVDAGKSPIK